MRGCYKTISLVIVLLIALSLFSTNILAMDKRDTWPEGVLQAFYADEGNTRNEAWIDKENRIISIPQGDEFDSGQANHGAYHFYSDFEYGDIYYIHWVVRVEETPDVDGMVIMSQDPAFLSEYTDKGQGEVEVGTGPSGLIDPDTTDVYYEDLTPGEWTVLSYGFEVLFDGTNHVQHRIHFKNVAPIQVKYLVVTTEDITSLTCDPETGEIDGITNDNQFAEATPEPSPEVTPTPDETPEETPAETQKSDPTPTPAASDSTPGDEDDTEGDDNLILIIVIAAAVVVIGGVVIFLVIKNKKK